MQMRRGRVFWEKTVAEQRASGQTTIEFARRRKLSVHTLRWWSARVPRETEPELKLLPVKIAKLDSAGTIEIASGNVIVRLPSSMRAADVVALVRALSLEC
jgi:hypothetical protein